ncbi:hypothetical protein LPJ72_000167 [Coemansia sp. Benny D160-2]|nr:hypothetical protein LPJ72_000167 [Coemansia sp. Benny D160-2]
MRYLHLSPVVFAVLFGVARAAPVPGPALERRQTEIAENSGDALDSGLDAPFDPSFDGGAGSGTADAWADPPDAGVDTAPLDRQADNLVGNSFAQIDDSTNIDNSSIEYPGGTQMTDNTGTAVSGNNNDIMPILNAPVTIVINSNNDKAAKRRPPSEPQPPPPVFAAQSAGGPILTAQQAAALSVLSSLSPEQLGRLIVAAQGIQQQPPLHSSADDAVSKMPAPSIERLIAYALAVSQSRL